MSMAKLSLIDIISRIGFMWIPIIMIPIILFGLVFAPEMDYYKEQEKQIEQRQQQSQNDYKIATNSLDCQELQKLQLSLLSQGYDADNWFDTSSGDRSLRIAQDKYEVLCK